MVVEVFHVCLFFFFFVSDAFHSIACFLCSSRQWYVSESIPVQNQRCSHALLVQHLSVDAGCHYILALLSNPAANVAVDNICGGCFYLDISPFLWPAMPDACYVAISPLRHILLSLYWNPPLSHKPLPGYLSRYFLLACSNHLSLILSGCHPGLPGLSTVATEAILVCQKAL